VLRRIYLSEPGRIDVHFHIIPPFYKEAVYAAGGGPAVGRYPEWSPELALEIIDEHGIETAITSVAQPGVQFTPPNEARTLARKCNEYAAEQVAKHPSRFGAFTLVPMHNIEDAVEEISYCYDTLKFEGVCLFASYQRAPKGPVL
jgi:predicted TIM-barrel fold metal-dependent hydrolase